jgi:hypothetical protein
MAKKHTLNDKETSPTKHPSGGVPAGLKITKAGIHQSHTGGSQSAGAEGHPHGKGGLARILEPEKNDDEFAKGTVGAPDELDGIREDGNQKGMDGDKTLLYGGGLFEREKPGLEDGVSVRVTMDADSTEPNYNYDIDPLTGNAPERKVGRANNYTVSGKRGNKFLIGEM